MRAQQPEDILERLGGVRVDRHRLKSAAGMQRTRSTPRGALLADAKRAEDQIQNVVACRFSSE